MPDPPRLASFCPEAGAERIRRGLDPRSSLNPPDQRISSHQPDLPRPLFFSQTVGNSTTAKMPHDAADHPTRAATLNFQATPAIMERARPPSCRLDARPAAALPPGPPRDLAMRTPNRPRTLVGRAARFALVASALGSFGARGADEPPVPAASPEALAFFEAKVRPVLVEQCAKCHGAGKQSGGLRLDSRAAILEGGDVGPSVVAGDPDKSPLVLAIRHQGDNKMPPKGASSPDPAADALAQWVRMGAPWPDRPGASAAAKADAGRATGRISPWSTPPPPPRQTRPGWRRRSMGSFWRKLDAAGSPLAPRRQADPDPPGHLRPDRPAADRGRGRRLPRRRRARGVREGGRPPPGLAPVRRAVGPALARRRPLCRHQGVRLHRGNALPVQLHLPRLRDPGLQRRPALRPVPRRADRRRPPAPGGRRPSPGGARVPDGRPPVPERQQRDHRRPDRRRDPRPARPLGHLRPLPRPQVRPDPDRGLLLAPRRLRLVGRARRTARSSPTPIPEPTRPTTTASARPGSTPRRTPGPRGGPRSRRNSATTSPPSSRPLRRSTSTRKGPSSTRSPASTRSSPERLRFVARRLGKLLSKDRRRQRPDHSAPGFASPRSPRPSSPPGRRESASHRRPGALGRPRRGRPVRRARRAAEDARRGRRALRRRCSSGRRSHTPRSPRSARRRPSPTRDWVVFQRLSQGENAVVTVADRRPVFNRLEQEQIDKLDKKVEELAVSHPGAPPRAMVLNDARRPVNPHVCAPREPRPPRQAGPPPVPPRPRRRGRGEAVHRGERPARTGPGHRQPRQPADRPGDGQPDLAPPLRRGAGHHPQRLRRPGRAALAPRAARLPGPAVRRGGLVGQGHAPADPALEHLSAAQRRPGRGARRRPPEPPPLAFQPQRVDFEATPRRGARRRGRPRPDDGGPLGRALRPASTRRPGGPSTASSTATTSTRPTGPSTSPAPTSAPRSAPRPRSRSRPCSCSTARSCSTRPGAWPTDPTCRPRRPRRPDRPALPRPVRPARRTATRSSWAAASSRPPQAGGDRRPVPLGDVCPGAVDDQRVLARRLIDRRLDDRTNRSLLPPSESRRCRTTSPGSKTRS